MTTSNVIAMPTNTIGEDVAEQEFDRWVTAMRLDFDPKGLSQEDLDSFAEHKYKMIKAMNSGLLIINAEGVAVFTPYSGGDPIAFHQPKGATLMASDTRKAGHNHEKMNAAMGEQTRQPPVRFAQMPLYDLKVCHAIFSLFLGSK